MLNNGTEPPEGNREAVKSLILHIVGFDSGDSDEDPFEGGCSFCELGPLSCEEGGS